MILILAASITLIVTGMALADETTTPAGDTPTVNTDTAPPPANDTTPPATGTTTITPEQKRELVIIQRESNQEKRIETGVKNGSLTAAETKRLETQLAKIEKDFERMKTNATPSIGPKEFVVLQNELNKNSALIYRLKHNAITPDKIGKK